jgi:predicted component of type VI protein secretion system
MACDDHYQYFYKGIKLDPYRIAKVYKISDGAQFQSLKKILRAGESIKDLKQDIDETIKALQRWKEMVLEDEDQQETIIQKRRSIDQ